MYILTCKNCGKEYESNSNRQGTCPECRMEKQKQRNREYLERRSSGQTRSIGATDICANCGKPFIIRTGSQKLCEECIEKGIRITRTKANNKYKMKTYDELHIFVSKGEKDKLKEFAYLHGKSLNEFVNEAIAVYKKQIDEEQLF